MRKSQVLVILLVVVSLVYVSLPPAGVSAQPESQQGITTSSQLIDVVNGLRLAYGLPTLAVHSILMQTAQSQADYMASTGQVTHTRPGGITYTQQLLMLGFPLSGDLSLGGFRAENILMQSDPMVWTGVPPAWQDADHMNTMLSQHYTHIGAGVSQNGDGYYYAVDCAASTGSGQMQSDAATILTSAPGSSESGNSAGISQYMVPISVSTARPGGDVFHKVQYGQTLWSIAIEYGTTIRNIQSLNNLGEDLVIYQGQELMVMKNATQPAPVTATVESTPTSAALPTSPPTTTPTYAMPTIALPATATRKMPDSEDGISSSRMLVVVLILAAFLGGGMAVWLIRDPNG